ncbi:putative glutamine amidotransferase-like protein C13C5.04 [Rhizophagus irregularis]|uniref:Putative glutamine amidotransferase-like protein C13C5.04 n=1 Tax=Rhizophagus irregularis TaxID=588596 RepID=A0A2I1FUJ4_9GLOM|nr:putative glutamine amidotransferase-like protein C13C5.04 [Rhizophagus irregularis]
MRSQKIFRTALLIADTPHPKIVEKYGDYYTQFTKFLQKGVVSSKKQIALDIKPYDVTKKEYPSEQELLDTEGIVITGSAASAHEDIPWINSLVEFVSSVIEKRPEVRMVGICFGHQIIARARGGQVIKNPLGWEVAVTEVSLTDIGKEILKTNRKSVRLQEMHKDIVSSIPPEFSNIGFTEICPIQGMIKDDHVLTFQAHPEFDSGVVKEIVNLRRDKRIFSSELAQKYLTAADYDVDDAWVGQKCVEFLTGGIEPGVIDS